MMVLATCLHAEMPIVLTLCDVVCTVDDAPVAASSVALMVDGEARTYSPSLRNSSVCCAATWFCFVLA